MRLYTTFFTVSYCIILSVYRMLSKNLINRHKKLPYRLISDIADYGIVNNALEPLVEYILQYTSTQKIISRL